MTIVDAAVWIDYFKGHNTPATQHLHDLLGVELVVMADLILAQVLQHFSDLSDQLTAQRALAVIPVIDVGGEHIAKRSSEYVRRLVQAGHPTDHTLSSLIATFCIEHQYPLLFADHVYQPFVQHLGLKRSSRATGQAA